MSPWNSGTSSHRRSPSGWSRISTSEMTSTAAASRSSRVRTVARSSDDTSARSLIDPDSPRDPHSSTTRTPASARRASVPPQASDSSSGCAKTTSTVRPSKPGGLAATMTLHDAPVHADVAVDHPRRPEPLDRPLAHAPAVEGEHARQLVRHVLEIVEHDAGHAVVDDLADRALVE